jgi:hypothetical protein
MGEEPVRRGMGRYRVFRGSIEKVATAQIKK